MSKNLWQVVNRDDLLYHLKNGTDRIIVLTLTLIDTDESIKTMLRKYIKRRSEQYPNIIFIYYAVRKEDIGKVGTLVPRDLNYYPVMYHIYNIKKLLWVIPSIDKSQEKFNEIDESFTKLDEYYSEFDPNLQKKMSDDEYNQSLHKNDNNNDDNNDDSNDNNNDSNNDNNNVNKNNINNMMKNIMNNTNNILKTQQNNKSEKIDKLTERKKLAEKIIFIKKKWEEYELTFFEEIKKRKKDETKLKNKEKSQNSD